MSDIPVFVLILMGKLNWFKPVPNTLVLPMFEWCKELFYKFSYVNAALFLRCILFIYFIKLCTAGLINWILPLTSRIYNSMKVKLERYIAWIWVQKSLKQKKQTNKKKHQQTSSIYENKDTFADCANCRII